MIRTTSAVALLIALTPSAYGDHFSAAKMGHNLASQTPSDYISYFEGYSSSAMHVSPTNQHGYYTAETSAVSMVTYSEVVAGSVVADHGRIHDAFPNGFSVSDTVVRGFRPGNPSAGISEGDILYPTSPTHWKVWW